MLLRVEVFEDDSLTSRETLYVSVASALQRRETETAVGDNNNNNDNDGVLLTIGRKGPNDINFSKEKTISRKHALLRCVAATKMTTTTTTTSTTSTDNADDENAPTKMMKACLPARNEEEEKACQQSPYGMCVVLEYLGRSGVFVAVPSKPEEPSAVAADAAAGAAEGSDTEEETDDEGISQQQPSGKSQSQKSVGPGGTLPSLATKDFFRSHYPRGTQPEMVKHEKNFVLPLGQTDDEEEAKAKIRVANRTAMMQISNSANTVKVTWIPIRVVFSGVDKEIQPSLEQSLYLCGGRPMDVMDRRITHLITSKRSPVAKQLTAWCLGIPMVSPDWLKAMTTGRKTLQEPLPNPVDFPPQQADEKFWDVVPRKALLDKYTMISTASDDAERLAEAAGVKIERLYELRDVKRRKQRIQELLGKGETACLCFAVEKLTSLDAGNVPVVSIRELAKSITAQRNTLTDTKKRIVGGNNVSFAASELETQQIKNGEGGGSTSQNDHASSQQDSIPDPGFSQVPLVFHGDFDYENEEEDDDDEAGKSQAAKKKDLSILEEEAVEEMEDGHNSKTKSGILKATSGSGGGEQQQQQQRQPSLGRANVMGWFTTAPKDDTKRLKIRQQASKAFAKENGGIEFEDPIVSKEIVRVITPSSTSSNSSSSNQRNGGQRFARAQVRGGGGGPAKKGVPDFRKFRKNHIPIADPTERVVLVDFIPERTEKQRQMTEQQKVLEEEQHRADALFRGDTTGMGGRKRRRN